VRLQDEGFVELQPRRGDPQSAVEIHRDGLAE
jgi:hypothetical protein